MRRNKLVEILKKEGHMEEDSLERLIARTWDKITNDGVIEPILQIKYVHFNKSCFLSKNEKISISMQIISMRRNNLFLDDINSAIDYLASEGVKQSKDNIVKCLKDRGIKITRETLGRYLTRGYIDIPQEVLLLNNKLTK